MIKALSFTSRSLQTGAVWVLRALVVDDYGDPSSDVPEITVTDPDGTVGPFDMTSTIAAGVYRLDYFTAVAGRHTATAEHPFHGLVSWVAEVSDVTADADMPSVETCNNYMGDHSWSDDDVQEMLDQERSNQFRVCRVPAAYPADLRGALHRRVQRALALKTLPLAVKESVEGESQLVLPGNDPEVRRLERPWRRLPIG